MRKLLLLRHAKAELGIAGQRDFDRALAERGHKAAALMGEYLARQGLRPDLALVSPARRTKETWELALAAFDEAPPLRLEDGIYEAAPGTLIGLINTVAPGVHTLLLVGHNPGMEALADILVGSGSPAARARMDEKFPTAGLAVIDLDVDRWSAVEPGTGRLDRFVTPKTLAAAKP